MTNSIKTVDDLSQDQFMQVLELMVASGAEIGDLKKVTKTSATLEHCLMFLKKDLSFSPDRTKHLLDGCFSLNQILLLNYDAFYAGIYLRAVRELDAAK